MASPFGSEFNIFFTLDLLRMIGIEKSDEIFFVANVKYSTTERSLESDFSVQCEFDGDAVAEFA